MLNIVECIKVKHTHTHTLTMDTVSILREVRPGERITVVNVCRCQCWTEQSSDEESGSVGGSSGSPYGTDTCRLHKIVSLTHLYILWTSFCVEKVFTSLLCFKQCRWLVLFWNNSIFDLVVFLYFPLNCVCLLARRDKIEKRLNLLSVTARTYVSEVIYWRQYSSVNKSV